MSSRRTTTLVLSLAIAVSPLSGPWAFAAGQIPTSQTPPSGTPTVIFQGRGGVDASGNPQQQTPLSGPVAGVASGQNPVVVTPGSSPSVAPVVTPFVTPSPSTIRVMGSSGPVSSYFEVERLAKAAIASASSEARRRGLSPQASADLIKIALLNALAGSGTNAIQLYGILRQAIETGAISNQIAVEIVSIVLPNVQPEYILGTLLSTGTTEAALSVTVLNPVTTYGGSSSGPQTTPKAYDPCEGVIAAYCG